jgi:hypothetical protein
LAASAASAGDKGLAGVMEVPGGADAEAGGKGLVCADAAPTFAATAKDAAIKMRMKFSSPGES